MKRERTLYDRLEISPYASPIVVRAAYRSLAQHLHPDKNSGTEAAGARLAEINHAYAILSDPGRRLRYDRTLALNEADTERRGIVPAADKGVSRFGAGNKVSRPFGFRPLN